MVTVAGKSAEELRGIVNEGDCINSMIPGVSFNDLIEDHAAGQKQRVQKENQEVVHRKL